MTNFTTLLRDARPAGRLPLAVAVLCGASLLSFARAAEADEIRAYDPATGEIRTERVFEVLDETWTQISYRPGPGKPLAKIDTRLVIEIRRSADDSQATAYRAAEEELARGNHAAARNAFGQIAGGGLVKDPANDTLTWKPFPAPEAGKAKWYLAYAQYQCALALYREGKAKGDKSILAYALRALESDAAGEKGFLQRYKEGKSRYYADAMNLKALVLLELGKPTEAAVAFDDLYKKSLELSAPSLAPRWSYEAKRGTGLIAEAKGVGTEAEANYEAAAAALQSLLEKAPDLWSRREFGRYFNEARVQKARVMRESAEKAGSPAEFGRLRTFLQTFTPEALKAKFPTSPPEVFDAVVAGAMAPSVQAIVENGVGLAYLYEKKYVDALFAFNEVRVKHYAVREEVPRALYYMTKAAEGAAQAAVKAEAKTLFEGQAAAARSELARAWKDTPWASKK